MGKKFLISFLKYFILAIVIIIFLIPIIWIISLGFRYPNEVYNIFPTKLTLMNIPKAINDIPFYTGGIGFLRTFENSILVTACSIIGTVIVSTLAAFGFSNYNFKFKEPIFITFLLSLMIPIQVLLIPLFILVKNLHLFGSYLVLILPYVTFNFPLSTLILRGFFEKIPIEIKESAKIDGARDFAIFTKIIIPLSKPAIATVCTIAFINLWNEFLIALVFIRNSNMQTLPLVLKRMLGSLHNVNYEIYGAMILLAIIPAIIFFILFQKWFVAGLSEGAIKG